ncbi:peptide methionine sulfoxide reductase [Sulfuricella denitrificans skB26]|uniref:Peptide methionine sulfoxide reductase MsrA n=1 Tax=Sulfuricella denitrificans (strain DSM 22764 / NBRC 105220 / skB26) TaxID=1163617 RepID=S6AIV1_SULDS|nr:peptide-methionine (S)-S-oxide reductase MsrA [Sulfuricella denitrificans]BAN36186.1 peptide methionine sulfoxide reductase [Sulfuricella denitrificans skB26]
MSQNRETATLAGGCFWCLEAVFELLDGVEKVESGYTAGSTVNPSYEEICSGTTGHAEAVRIAFDPAVISCRDLLEVFFTIHDPTTLNRQGNDAGTQYRSAIFTHSPEQKAIAEEVVAGIPSAVTEIVPAGIFYVAEDYHQEYFRGHGNQPYCRSVVAPKVAKLKEKFKARLKSGSA